MSYYQQVEMKFRHEENVRTKSNKPTVQCLKSKKTIMDNLKLIEDNENTEIIEQEKKPPKANPYWDYIKMNLFH